MRYVGENSKLKVINRFITDVHKTMLLLMNKEVLARTSAWTGQEISWIYIRLYKVVSKQSHNSLVSVVFSEHAFRHPHNLGQGIQMFHVRVHSKEYWILFYRSHFTSFILHVTYQAHRPQWFNYLVIHIIKLITFGPQARHALQRWWIEYVHYVNADCRHWGRPRFF